MSEASPLLFRDPDSQAAVSGPAGSREGRDSAVRHLLFRAYAAPSATPAGIPIRESPHLLSTTSDARTPTPAGQNPAATCEHDEPSGPSAGNLPPMRGYQQEAIEAIVDGLTGGGRGQLRAACGSGKSLMALHAALRLCPSGLVVVACPSLSLVAQTLAVWAAARIAVSSRQAAHTRMARAEYARSASQSVCCPQSELSLAAARAYAQVLAEQNMLGDAIGVHDEIIATLERDSVVQARCDLAGLLYAHGLCSGPDQQFTAAYEFWFPRRSAPGERRRGAAITMDHAAVLAGCGRHDDALTLLREPQQVFQDPTDSDTRRRVNAIVGCARINQAIADHQPACTGPAADTPAGRPVPPPISEYHNLLYGDAGAAAGTTRFSRLLAAVSWPRWVVRWIP